MNLRRQADLIAKKHGIPPKLFRNLIKHESGWRANAVSPAGAIGLAQLMPGTAAGLGVDPHDPLQNMTGGAKYLKTQYDKFKSWKLALAAYNAGPGRVSDGSWTGISETRNYVESIMSSTGPLAKTPKYRRPSPNQTVQAQINMPPLELDLSGFVMEEMSAPSGRKAGLKGLTEFVVEGEQALEKQRQEWMAANPPQPQRQQQQPSKKQPAQRESGNWQNWVTVLPARGNSSAPAGQEIVSWVGGLGERANKRLQIWDGTTHSKFTVNGNVSAHYSGRAADIPASGAELRRLGYLALRKAGMGEKAARAAQRSGGLFNVGRMQIIFATEEGGNHYDHLHVGLRR